jgi:MFS family permease
MSNPYAIIFRKPGTKGFAAAGFIARLPVAMVPIGIVTMVSQARGAFWLAGGVAAVFTLTNAVLAPQISRLVDRFGQARLLVPATALAVAAFAAMVLAVRMEWPDWTLFVTAALAAVMPSMSAMVRARWTEQFRGRPELGTAFAFESVADELVYIAGASLSVALSVALFPEAGIVASTILLATGSTAFLLQRRTEPTPRLQGHAKGSAIRLRPVQVVTLAMLFVGSMFATAEVSTVALTRELGQPEAASWIVGVYAMGSFFVGIIFGAASIKAPLNRQIIFAVGALLVTSIPLPMAGSVPTLGAAIFLSGMAVSPTFITAFGLVEKKVPQSMLTEGITWVGTGIGAGMAAGAFVAGWVVDASGARSGFWVSIVAAAIALGIVALGQRWLADDDEQPAQPRLQDGKRSARSPAIHNLMKSRS